MMLKGKIRGEVEVGVTVRSKGKSTSTSEGDHFRDGNQVDAEGGTRRLQKHLQLPRSDVLIVQKARRAPMELRLQ
jgi:hypothetical protein